MFSKYGTALAVVVGITLFFSVCWANPYGLPNLPEPLKGPRGMGGMTVVSGQVRDIVTGVPIPGAIVTAVNAYTNEVYKLSSRTGEDGRYVLRLPYGCYVIQAGTTLHASTRVEARGRQVQADLLLGDTIAPTWSLSPRVLDRRRDSALVRFSGSVLDNYLLRDASLALDGKNWLSETNIFSSGYEFSFEVELAYGSHEINGSALDVSGNNGSPRINFELSQIPEPASVYLLGLSILGLAAYLRRRK